MGVLRPFWELEGCVTGLGKRRKSQKSRKIFWRAQASTTTLLPPAKTSVDETLRMRSQRINDANFFWTASPPAAQLTRPLSQWPDDMGRKLGARSPYQVRTRASFKDTGSTCVWVDSMIAAPLSRILPSCPEIDHSATKKAGIEAGPGSHLRASELLASGTGRRNHPLTPTRSVDLAVNSCMAKDLRSRMWMMARRGDEKTTTCISRPQNEKENSRHTPTPWLQFPLRTPLSTLKAH